MSSVPPTPTVLNTTGPSNFAHIERMDLLESLPRVCTVPEVRSELQAGVDKYEYLQRALDVIGKTIPVVRLDESSTETATELGNRLDPEKAQALAVAEIHAGIIVTDDGPARALARSRDVQVTGSIGVLIAAVEADRITNEDADSWLKRWIDETDYRAPSREFTEYL